MLSDVQAVASTMNWASDASYAVLLSLNDGAHFGARANAGYVFGGWYADAALLEPVSEENPYRHSMTKTRDTLYTEFMRKRVRIYTLLDEVRLICETEYTSDPAVQAFEVAYGSACTLKNKAGVTVAAWYDNYYSPRRKLGSGSSYSFTAQSDRTIVPEVVYPERLDTKSTANCYIAPATYKWYSFDATTMGNGKATTGVAPKKLSGVEARVIWETGTRRGAVVQDAVYSDGRIAFKTGDTHGNAVVGLFDAAGKCIWSWHIWAVDFDPNQGACLYSTGKVFMNRNLGALGISASDVSTKGLFYQWGRKDPFPWPATNRSMDNFVMSPVNCLNGYAFEVYGYLTEPRDICRYSIQGATEHPTTFLSSIPDPPVGQPPANAGSWVYPSNQYLWADATGRNKTIYDPCPPGWRVPPPEAWDRTYFKGYTSSGEYGWYMNYAAGNTASTFYPFSGYMDDGGARFQYYLTASQVKVWSNKTAWMGDMYQTARSVDVLASGMVQFSTSNRQAYGLAVRCIEE